MITEETINEIRSQLWSHLQYLIAQIAEVGLEKHIVKNWDWLGDQYNFCKIEIEYWKRVDESAQAKC